MHADIYYSKGDTTLENTIGEYPIGTTAKIYCNGGYYVPGSPGNFFESFCSIKKEWNEKVHDCLPEPKEKYTGFIVGGTEIDRKHVPFHIAIYQNFNGIWKYTCGGSIIDRYMVVSAAHCFWDHKLNRFSNETRYFVQAGTVHMDPDEYKSDSEDPQRRNITKIVGAVGYVL